VPAANQERPSAGEEPDASEAIHHRQANQQRDVAELAAATGELPAALVRVMPALLNATAGVLSLSGYGGDTSPGARVLEAATLLEADVAQVLPDFLQAVAEVEGAGSGPQQPLAAFEHVVVELRRTVTRRFLPAYLSAARDLSRNTTVPLLYESAGSMEDELAALARLLAHFEGRSTPANWPNVPACVSGIAASLADLVKGEQQSDYLSGDCEGQWRSPLDCAGDVAILLQRFADASSLVGDAAFDCGGNTSAGCQQATSSTYASLVSAAAKGVVAAADCTWPLSDGVASVEWCETAVVSMAQAFQELSEHSLEAAQLCGPMLDQASAASLESISASVAGKLAGVLPGIERATRDLRR